MLFIKVNRYRLEKAKKSPHLVPEKRSITRAGKTFMMTVWVDPADKKKGKGKRSPVEDKTPSQMSLFDMGDLSGKPKEKPEMSAGLDRIMNKPLDGLALRQLNKIIAEGKLEENVPDAKENMPMIMARIAEQEAKYKARSEELDKREEERAKRRQAEKDRVKNPAIIKDTDLKTPEEIKNRIVSITRQWNKINDLIETPSRKKQREKLSERKEYLEKKLKDQGMKKSIFSFAKNWIQGNR